MSAEPVAKRTRLSVSRSKEESTCDAEEMQTEVRMLHCIMISKCDEIVDELLPRMNQGINATKELVSKPGIEYQRQAIEFNTNAVQSHVISAQQNLTDIRNTIAHMFIERLHTFNCDGSDECLLNMQRLLIRDPRSLECRATIRAVNGSLIHRRTCSPLHDAVRRGHVKCVKFLLERGANVTSITTMSHGTILHTLYMNHTSKYYDKRRLEILKLLLKYGVSFMFQHNQTGGFAIRMASILNGVEEVGLLLQHGATMNHLETQKAILHAWQDYDLPLVKQFFLHCPNQLYIPQSLYKDLIQHCYMKMVLPGVPLSLCHEKLLEALQLYKVFGGKFEVHPHQYPTRDLLRYLAGYRHKGHFTGVVLRIETLISNPMSLKEISRLAVFKCISKNYAGNIKKLPVNLQPILRFDDVPITKKPDDFDGDSFYLSSNNNSDSSEEDDE